MYSKKDKLNMLYIFMFLVIAAFGINNSLGITAGDFKPPIFYTSVSGIICFIYFFIAFVRGLYFISTKQPFDDNLFLFPRVKGAVTICITVTFLIYHFVVYEGPVLSVDGDIFNLITHYFVPVLVILHWIIFDKKGRFKMIDPLLWTLIPMSYFAWANIVALQHTVIPYWDGDFYPYSFMDLTIHSPSTVLVTVIVIFIFFVALGYVVYYADYKLSEDNVY